MIGFSTQSLNVLQGFSQNMGIPQVDPMTDGSVTYHFDRAGTLCFAPSEDGTRIVVTLKRPAHGAQTEDLKRFLALSHWDSYLALTINAGMGADNGLVLAASIQERDFNLQTVEQCVDRLISLHGSHAPS